MPRRTLPEAQVHPAIRATLADHHKDIVDEVVAAIAAHDVVVVGMKQNPFPKKARKALAAKGRSRPHRGGGRTGCRNRQNW